jgi:hypothetical protein
MISMLLLKNEPGNFVKVKRRWLDWWRWKMKRRTDLLFHNMRMFFYLWYNTLRFLIRTTEPSKSPEWEMLAATVENFGLITYQEPDLPTGGTTYHGPQQAARKKEPE